MYIVITQLVKEYGIARDLLPPKKFGKSTDSDIVSQRKIQLEQYLQRIINRWVITHHSTTVQPVQSGHLWAKCLWLYYKRNFTQFLPVLYLVKVTVLDRWLDCTGDNSYRFHCACTVYTSLHTAHTQYICMYCILYIYIV